MGMFQTNPLLGHLEDAAGMQIGPGVLLLSMMNPVLAAEEAATGDWLIHSIAVLLGQLTHSNSRSRKSCYGARRA
jgi:hypothetical protein